MQQSDPDVQAFLSLVRARTAALGEDNLTRGVFLQPPAHPTPGQAAAALAQPMQVATGLTFITWAQALAQGLDATLYQRCIVLAAHSTRAHTYCAWYDDTGGIEELPTDPTDRALVRLINAAEGAISEGGVRVERVMPWLDLLAASPPLASGWRLWSGVQMWIGKSGAAFGETVGHWDHQVGPLASLAWAAGMNLDDAASMAAAGTLDAQALRDMAAVRGFALPAPGAASIYPV